MGQQVSQREQDAVEEIRQQLNGIAGLVQCDGCPAGVLVQPGRPGHRADCDLCERHCTCFKPQDGVGFLGHDNPSQLGWAED